MNAIYDGVKKPILTIKQALKKAEDEGKLGDVYLPKVLKIERETKAVPKNNIKGEFEIGSQYHFQMEPQTTICIPREDGMDVYCATQWMDQVQACIASMLSVSNNRWHISTNLLKRFLVSMELHFWVNSCLIYIVVLMFKSVDLAVGLGVKFHEQLRSLQSAH